MLVRFLTFVALVALGGYGLVEAYPLLAGPGLAIDSPREGTTATDGEITIRGVALRAEALTLDGESLLMHKDGSFETALTPASGSAILSLTATDRFGRSVTERRTVFVP